MLAHKLKQFSCSLLVFYIPPFIYFLLVLPTALLPFTRQKEKHFHLIFLASLCKVNCWWKVLLYNFLFIFSYFPHFFISRFQFQLRRANENLSFLKILFYGEDHCIIILHDFSDSHSYRVSVLVPPLLHFFIFKCGVAVIKTFFANRFLACFSEQELSLLTNCLSANKSQ